jgi:hypothetical protein
MQLSAAVEAVVACPRRDCVLRIGLILRVIVAALTNQLCCPRGPVLTISVSAIIYVLLARWASDWLPPLPREKKTAALRLKLRKARASARCWATRR